MSDHKRAVAVEGGARIGMETTEDSRTVAYVCVIVVTFLHAGLRNEAPFEEMAIADARFKEVCRGWL